MLPALVIFLRLSAAYFGLTGGWWAAASAHPVLAVLTAVQVPTATPGGATPSVLHCMMANKLACNWFL